MAKRYLLSEQAADALNCIAIGLCVLVLIPVLILLCPVLLPAFVIGRLVVRYSAEDTRG